MAKIIQPIRVVAFPKTDRLMPRTESVPPSKLSKYHIIGYEPRYETYMTSCGLIAKENDVYADLDDVMAKDVCKRCLGRIQLED